MMLMTQTHALDRADYQSFLIEYGITEEHVRAVTYSGKRHYLSMDDIDIRKSAIQGYGLFAKRLIRAGEIIAPATLNGTRQRLADTQTMLHYLMRGW